MIKSLNDSNLLNKKSELVNTCHHQNKLLLKSFKKNSYSERNDTMDWFLVFDISSFVFDVSVCYNTFWGILTYSPFQKSILFLLLVYTTPFSKSFKVVYRLMGRYSTILEGVNKLYYAFCFFRSIVKCMPYGCVSMRLWVAYRTYFLNHRCYIAFPFEHSAEISTNDL